MRQEKLSSLCKISNGYAFKSDDYVNQGHRVMRITSFIWKFFLCYHSKILGGCAEVLFNINAKQISSIGMPLPPKSLQEDFAVFVVRTAALKCGYQQSLSDLESLYGALSQQAFKGELDLSQVQQSMHQPEGGQSK